MAGDNVTWVDFIMFETLELMKFVSDGKVFEMQPHLKDYHDRMCNLPKLKEYLASDKWLQAPFLFPQAKIGNV